MRKFCYYQFNRAGVFTITNAKLYFPIVTLSTHDNIKLLIEMKSDFIEQLTGINIRLRQQHRQQTST